MLGKIIIQMIPDNHKNKSNYFTPAHKAISLETRLMYDGAVATLVDTTATDTLVTKTTDGTIHESVAVPPSNITNATIFSGDDTGSITENSNNYSLNGLLTVNVLDHSPTIVSQSEVTGGYGIFSINSDGNWTYTADNTKLTPLTLTAEATDTFTVKAEDGTTHQVVITLNGVAEKIAEVGPAGNAIEPFTGIVRALPNATEILFIDSAVPDISTLIAGTRDGIEIVILNTDTNPWQQMSDIISQHQDLAAVHILSHGSEGSIILNGANYTTSSLLSQSNYLQVWQSHLTQSADILIYGCNIGAGNDGQLLIDTVAQITQADVAASTDNTGASSLSGNWFLETNSGRIETPSLISENYSNSWSYLLYSVNQYLTVDNSDNYYAYDRYDGTISTSSKTNFARGTGSNFYNDLYTLSGVADGTWVRIYMGVTGSLTDPYLQITNSSGTVIVQDDDGGSTWHPYDAYVNFQWYSTYTIRATTYSAGTTGTYSIFTNAGTLQVRPDAAPYFTSSAVTLNYSDTSSYDQFSSSGTFTAYDADNDALSFSGTSTGNYGTLTVNTSGTWSWDANDSAVNALANGQTITDFFTVKVNDGRNLANQTFTVNITGTNDAPSVTSNSTASFAENTATSTTVYMVTGSDPENQTLTYSLSGTDASLFNINSSTGTVTFKTSPNYESPLDSDGNNVYDITVAATDTGSLSANKSVAITVTNVNDEAPTVAAPLSFTVTEDVAGNILFTGSPFSDVDSSSLTVTLSVSDGTITGNSGTGVTVGGSATSRTFSGTVNDLNTYFTTSGKITWQTAQDRTTSRTLSTTVSDGSLSNSATSSITVTAVDDAPVLTLSNSSPTYSENDSNFFVDIGLSITDVDSTTIDGAKVVISTNFSSSQDSLSAYGTNVSWSGTSGSYTGSGGTITMNYNSTTGVMTLSGTSNVSDYQAALRTIRYSNSSDSPSTASRQIDITCGSAVGTVLEDNLLHFYEFVSSAGISWTSARDAAALKSMYGATGYLATITSQTESNFVVSKVSGTTWIGASDADVEGTWKWMTGPEAGTNLSWTNWNTGEPNNSGGNEDYAHIMSWTDPAGKWNDLPDAGGSGQYASTGYLVEYNMSASSVSFSKSLTLGITAANDAPVLNTSYTPTMTDITEDVADASNTGTQIATMVADGSMNDADGSAVESIYVTAVDTVHGSWQYKVGAGNWTTFDFNGSNVGKGLLLASTDRVRFVPATDWSGSATLTFGAWDATSGTAGTYAGLSSTGSTSSFSTETDTATITVSPINDAPVFNTSYTPTMTDITEDVADASNTGTQIATMVADGSMNDADGTAVESIYVTTVDTVHGSWQYKVGAGNWTTFDFNGSNAGKGLLLASTDRVRFVPATDWSGSATLTFGAWDATSGTAGTYAGLSSTGSTSSFSTETDTATITVSPINDAPIISLDSNPYAIYLDGTTGYLSSTSSLLNSLTNYTISFWINPDRLTAGLRQDLVGQNDAFEIFLTGTQLTFWNTGSGQNLTFDLSSVLSVGGWTNLAITGNTSTSTVTVYANGVSLGSQSHSVITNYGSSSYSLNVGGYVSDASTAHYFQGYLDEVSIWNIAKSTTEVVSLQKSSLTGSETGLIGYWSMNTGSGSTETNSVSGALSSTTLTLHTGATRVASTLGSQATYTEQAIATGLKPWIVLSDADNTTLASATVSITSGFVSGDVLSFTNDNATMGNIGGSYNSATGALTLNSSGSSATIAQWTSALKSITFYSSSDTPGTSRTIGWSTNDGELSSTTASSTIQVIPVNDSPTLSSVNLLSNATEDTSYTISYDTLAAAANEADLDGDTLSFRIESISSGTLTKGGSAITAGATLLSYGESLAWTPAANANGTLNAFTVKVWDGSALSSSAVQVQVSVSPVNDAPVLYTGSDDTVQMSTGTTTPTLRLAIPVTGVVTGDIVKLTYLGQSTTGVTLTASDIANGYIDIPLTISLQDLSSNLDSVSVKWIDWTSYNSSTHVVSGTFTTEGGSTITATLSNSVDYAFVQLTGGTNYFVPTTPYVSTGVVAPTTSDIIAFNLAGTRTLTFSSDVSNLYFAYVSLNGNGYQFDRDFDIISGNGEAGYFGSGTMVKNTVVINGQTYYQLNASGPTTGTGSEPHGVIRFKGTFSTLTWTTSVNEYWNGFTLGIKSSLSDLETVRGQFYHSGSLVASTASNIIVYNTNASSTAVLDVSASSALVSETNSNLTANGSISLYDVDTADVVTVRVDSVSITGATTDFSQSNATVLTWLTASCTDTNLLQASKVNWSFNSGTEDFNWLSKDEELVLNYTITVDDHAGGSDASIVKITVVGTNDSPVISTPASGSYTDTDVVDTFSNITGTLITTDADYGATKAFGIFGGSVNSSISSLLGTYGTLMVNTSSGGYTYTPNATAINALTANATDTFTITVSDGTTTTNATYTVNITGANDAPTLAAPTAVTYTDGSGNESFSANTGTLFGSDCDNGATLTYGISSVTAQSGTSTKAGNYGSLSVTSTGGYTYTPNATAINALTANATDTFTITVSDGTTTTNTTYTVNITGANDAPALETPISALYTDESGNESFSANTGTLIGSDRDNGATLIYGISGITAQNGTSTKLGNYGRLSVTSSGGYTYTPNDTAINALTANATDTFTITVSDGAITSSSNYTITIVGSNDLPTPMGEALSINNITEPFVALGDVTSSGTFSFSDVDLGDIHHVSSVTASADALGTLLVEKATDTAGIGTEGHLAWRYSVNAKSIEYLHAKQTKIETFRFTLFDSANAAIEFTVNIIITGTDANLNISQIVLTSNSPHITVISSQPAPTTHTGENTIDTAPLVTSTELMQVETSYPELEGKHRLLPMPSTGHGREHIRSAVLEGTRIAYDLHQRTVRSHQNIFSHERLSVAPHGVQAFAQEPPTIATALRHPERGMQVQTNVPPDVSTARNTHTQSLTMSRSANTFTERISIPRQRITTREDSAHLPFSLQIRNAELPQFRGANQTAAPARGSNGLSTLENALLTLNGIYARPNAEKSNGDMSPLERHILLGY